MTDTFVPGAVEVDRDKLILDHIPLLQHIVERMSFDSPGRIQRDDLFGWGMRGLIEAADAFPMNLGFAGKGNASLPDALLEQVVGGACALKLKSAGCAASMSTASSSTSRAPLTSGGADAYAAGGAGPRRHAHHRC